MELSFGVGMIKSRGGVRFPSLQIKFTVRLSAQEFAQARGV